MVTYVRCGSLFTGDEDAERKAQTLAFDDAGRITWVGPTDKAPAPAKGDAVLDYGDLFVMPGLHDVHTHLAYGNAKTEEDIDLYQPMEFRAIRGLFCRCAMPSISACSTVRASRRPDAISPPARG